MALADSLDTSKLHILAREIGRVPGRVGSGRGVPRETPEFSEFPMIFREPREFNFPTAECTNRATVCANCTMRKHLGQRAFWLFPAVRCAIRL